MKPASPDAMRLLMQGSAALATMEANGMPVSLHHLKETSTEISDEIQTIKGTLRDDPIFLAQRRRFGKDCSVGSRDQLAQILYGELKLPGATFSKKTGKYTLDEAALESIDNDHDIPYISKFRRLSKLLKLKSTYLDGLLAECVDGRVHGIFNLHLVKTYRGSADTPNLNNLPSRDKSLSRYVKQCIRPREGWNIVEIDFSSLEVRIGACYHKDPTMLDYLENDYDMHRDVSKQCYIYDDAWIEQNPELFEILRTAAKGDATFGWQYGNYYVDVGKRLWTTATRNDLLPHLASKGIKRLGLERDWEEDKWIEHHGPDAFVTHIKAVEGDFWGRRFKVYNHWRTEWYEAYKRKGFFYTMTGFRWHGVEKKNFIINCPIQGAAFHVLLQSIIDIQKELERRRMESLLIIEIHDSLIAEVPDEELDDYIGMATDIMENKVREKWPWIITDLPVKVEYSPVSWSDKEAYARTT